MLDTFNLPNVDNNIQVFYENSSTWQMWNKPIGCSFVKFFILGGGGGGSGGVSGAANTTRRGGAGGGSSAISVGTFAAFMLPSTLFIYVGAGGASGAAGALGSDGEVSYVSVDASTSPGSVILSSGTAAGGGAAGGATGGTAGGVFVRATMGYLGFYGILYLNTGQAGAIGGSGAIGTSQTLARPFGGGAGGGGPSNTTNFAGGQISGSGIFPTLLGGVGGATTVASNGYVSGMPIANISNSRPTFFMGGSGGGSNRTGTGGIGGNGSYGSGGGGGGGGTTGGRGGNGGDGIIVITSW